MEISIHLPFIIDCSKSLRHSAAFKNYSLQTLSNCTARDYLKSQLLYHGALDAFIENLKDKHNLMGNRISAKALV